MKVKKLKEKKEKQKPQKIKTRKQLRQEKRKEKKAKRQDYYTNRRKPGQYVLLHKSTATNPQKNQIGNKQPEKTPKDLPIIDQQGILIKKEKKVQKTLQKEMKRKRNKQLISANEEEDKNIKKLEKQLKLNKRKKSKSIPQSFASDGLDYLLEVCDLEKFQENEPETNITDINSDFEEDLNLMMEDTKQITDSNVSEESSEENSDDESITETMNKSDDYNEINQEDISNDDDDSLEDENGSDSDSLEDENGNDGEKKDCWEDIYGRLRNKKGSILNVNDDETKYVPPALRSNDSSNVFSDEKRTEKLVRLKKLLKGSLNRLAESNMHNISTKIEELYMNNSRNDMNETLTNLIFDSVVSHILSPERLLMEHIVLVIILHANVGSEVGAHFLQNVVKKFDILFNKPQLVEDKTLDNIVLILSQLYNFKLYNSQLIYEILDKLTEKFDEKCVECILHILKAIGFGLRKDDPLALKTLILNIQKRAISVADDNSENSRVQYMLDILLAIKNNNVTKIPNYDTSYSEHLKKLLRGFIRKGNYVTQLNITLEDLLKADERGKWWVVGSAWSGNLNKATPNDKEEYNSDSFSEKLLLLAKKQRMNTDTRKNIFCIIMSAEDYLDAFEKLLHLGLKNQQEREIIHVILHCCLQEKNYNQYYGVLAQKFCDYDRKYQMAIKFSVWDKLKAIKESSTSQISNLAKLLTHLFLEKGLPISTLKIVQFSELDKTTLRFMRQTLLGILLHEDVETCTSVFEKVAHFEKLRMFRDSLRLFIHHFLLKNLKSDAISEDKRILLEERAKMVEKILVSNDKRVRF